MKRFALPCLAVLLLAGCAGAAPDSPSPESPSLIGAGGEGESGALDLVNLWRVSGAEGESDQTWLRLEAQELQLWRECGMITGSWQGNDSLFLGSTWGAMGDCSVDGMPSVDGMRSVGWIEEATGFIATASGYDLIDSDGAVLASLSIDGAPEPIPTAAEFYTQPPQITAEVREHFAKAAVLPSGLTPATKEALVGTWVPVGVTATTNPHVLFTVDSNWTGTDGCNGSQGRWTVGAGGEFLATSGPQTMVYCEGAPIPFWVSATTSAGFDAAGELVLVDAAGAELGRLIH